MATAPRLLGQLDGARMQQPLDRGRCGDNGEASSIAKAHPGCPDSRGCVSRDPRVMWDRESERLSRPKRDGVQMLASMFRRSFS
jgi:hypothetical protein